ncbi:bifunctional riboflavin kinase/FAD synthetase [Acetobacter syzygii]|uniref:Riboflavin biosynthesis protein n=1 Tax=Acetobacter syzygii TaxID=146476 RepID=A0A270BPC4_9PROT|nr:bifunctional riboflavin kinase/FAD synthetase [Acetobacter syzygii]NSL92231.1 bifunctional riboflavin kinase/FAD synthetase [Acetobacter syzygii]PAL26601.1 bifunctional riboflavin kinase/FMN adenylyltransferase [Acetobacter syzygii]PAL26785.1 bifunctional riboflavin kinase/FMN adenylyltransferase [Acetobacter syzygii]GAN70753.1 riboflavin kinase RibF [Acetobacter syzygii]GBR62885.1 riboflavin kinase RibF [Acetobacter syzygii NRIC 0483]
MTICLHTNWRDIPAEAHGCAAALGNFDGVHLGHAHLLRSVFAARPDLPPAVVTFEPHPRELFRPQDPPFRLTLSAERLEALRAVGVRHVFQIGFDKAFSELTAEQFVEDVLHGALHLRHVGCGPDFAFGHRRGGNVAFLAERTHELGMGFTAVQALADAGGPFSSSRIRRLLQDGYPEEAAEELGRKWCIRGTVQHGDKRGRLLGFPTANIPLGRHLEPARGVYAVTVRLPDGQTHRGVANIGRRPTINDGQESRLEAHLFDFEGDLYGQELSVALHSLLREEKRFAGLDALKNQIEQDAAQARKVLDAGAPRS